jgi:hypothetical protein
MKADKAAAIRKQLSKDYPEESMNWIGDLEWSGPMEVPLKEIDVSNRKTWNAYHEPERVRHFEGEIRKHKAKGGHEKPVILVDTPDTPSQTHLIVIDGHHRTLGYMKAGEPVWAYVGKASKVKGPWLHFHNMQCREGKAGTDEYADEPRAS